MKIRIVGGPVEGKVEVETKSSENFSTILVQAETVIGKGPLHEKYQFHRCEIVDKKAKAVGLLSPTDTPQSVGLPATGAILMLKAIAGSPVGTPRDAPAADNTAKAPKTFKERMVAIYEKYEPAKVGSVDATLEKFKGKEEAVIKKLVEKYGPEPQAEVVVPPATNSSPPAETNNIVATPTPKTYKERMLAIYEKYEPAKVGSVDATLEKFKGKEEAVIKKLVEKYGPEPVVESAASPQRRPSVVEEKPRTRAVSVKSDPPTATPPPPQQQQQQQQPSAPEPPARDRSQSKVSFAAPPPEAVEPAAPPPEAEHQRSVVPPPEPATESVVVPEPVIESRPATVTEVVKPQPDEPQGKAQSDEQVIAPSAQSVVSEPAAPSSSSALAAEAPPLASQPQAPCPPKLTDPRFAAVVAKIIRRAFDEANHNLLHDRWNLWLQHTLEQKAERLVKEGKWKVSSTDGAYECPEASPPFRTPDLVSFLKQAEGTTRTQVLSDSLSDVIRVALRKSIALTSGSVQLPVLFRDDATTTHLINNNIVLAVDIGLEAVRENEQLRRDIASVVAEREQLQVANVELSQKLLAIMPMAEKATDIASHAEALEESHKLLEQRFIATSEENKKNSAELSRVVRELDNERRGLPTDLEIVIRQKDTQLAGVQQELAKLRLKLRSYASTEIQYRNHIQELEADVALLERSRQTMIGFSRRTPSGSQSRTVPPPVLTHFTSNDPLLSARPMSSRSPLRPDPIDLSNLKSPSPSQPKVPMLPTAIISRLHADPVNDVSLSDDLNYEPSPRISSRLLSATTPKSSQREVTLSKELRDLNMKSDILAQELSRPPPKADDAGPCPHCNTALTPFHGGSEVEDGNCKKAFCFCCRRSFTHNELSQYNRAKRGGSHRRSLR